MGISTLLNQCPANLPPDSPALERCISALESSIANLERSSAFWEKMVWPFAALVVAGVLVELFILRVEYRHELDAWRRGIVRPPEMPSLGLFFWASIATLAVAIGVAGEFAIGIRVAILNQGLRTDGEQLRSASDQLVALVLQEAGDANLKAEKANERTAVLEKETVQLRSENIATGRKLEQERTARVDLEAKVGWRAVSSTQLALLKRQLQVVHGQRLVVRWDTTDPEQDSFGSQLAEALQEAGPIVGRVTGQVYIPGLKSHPLSLQDTTPNNSDLAKVLAEALEAAALARSPIPASRPTSILIGGDALKIVIGPRGGT